MTATSSAPAAAPPAGRARRRLVLAQVAPAWARAVVVIVGAALLPGAVGLADASGYAIIPGLYLVLSPPAGSLRTRVETSVLAGLVAAALVFAGAEVSGAPAVVVIALTAMGFAAGLLPRVGPRAAALQLPILMGFAYSAALPLSDAPATDRAAAVLVAMPVVVLAAAVLFQTDARRPLVAGAAGALRGIAAALADVTTDLDAAERAAEAALVRFRVATGRMRDAALPTGGAPESRAGRLLTTSVHRLVTAVGLLAASGRAGAGAGTGDARSRARIGGLADAAEGVAAALAGSAPIPAPGPLDAIADEADADPAGGPAGAAVAAMAAALADAARAAAVLRGEAADVPGGALSDLPGAVTRVRLALTPEDPVFRRALRLAAAVGGAALVAAALGLTRTYWAVFAAVVVLNAPAALDRRRALMRIAGTAGGLVLAIAVVAAVGTHAGAAVVLGVLLLLPGMLLMPVNYAGAVLFITCAVGLFYSASGDEADFLGFRLVDNAVGVAVVGLVSVLLWRTSRDDWWRSARLTATTLAGALASGRPGAHGDALMARALQVRTETVEAAALPDPAPAASAAWTFVAAAEDLVRIVLGHAPASERSGDAPALVRSLRAVAAACAPGAGVPERAAAGAPVRANGGGPPVTTLAAVDVARMGRAVDALGAADQSRAM